MYIFGWCFTNTLQLPLVSCDGMLQTMVWNNRQTVFSTVIKLFFKVNQDYSTVFTTGVASLDYQTNFSPRVQNKETYRHFLSLAIKYVDATVPSISSKVGYFL